MYNRIKAFSLIVILSASSCIMVADTCCDFSTNRNREDDERDKQKAMLTLIGSAGLFALSKYLQSTEGFKSFDSILNLQEGEFQAACALATALSAIGFIANDDIAKPCRSLAWRIPLLAAVGGIISHDKVNEGLSLIPLSIGDWFKNNPAKNKKGIFAIYAVGAWYLLKPSLDRIENYFSEKTSQAVNYLT
jgi:hypothetical protein